MTTQKTNQLNSCCYNHLLEDQVDDIRERSTEETSSFRLRTFSHIVNFYGRMKFWLLELTASAAIAIVYFILNLFI